MGYIVRPSFVWDSVTYHLCSLGPGTQIHKFNLIMSTILIVFSSWDCGIGLWNIHLHEWIHIILENPFMYMLSSVVYYISWSDVFILTINVLFRWYFWVLLINESLLIRLGNSLHILLLKLPIQYLKILICQNLQLQGCFPLVHIGSD